MTELASNETTTPQTQILARPSPVGILHSNRNSGPTTYPHSQSALTPTETTPSLERDIVPKRVPRQVRNDAKRVT